MSEPGPQAREGADNGALAYRSTFKVAEGPNHRARRHLHPRREDHVRLDTRAGRDLGIPAEEHGLRRAHSDARQHQRRAASGLERGLGGGDAD